MNAQLTPQVRVALAQFMSYITSFWIERVGPERFSVCGDGRRTNNNVESWHRRLNQVMGGAHLNFWEFVGEYHFILLSYCFPTLISFILDKLQIIGNLAVRDYLSLAAGRNIRDARRQMYQRRDRQISSATTMLLSNRMSILDFLRLGALFFDPEQGVTYAPEPGHVLGDEFEVIS